MPTGRVLLDVNVLPRWIRRPTRVKVMNAMSFVMVFSLCRVRPATVSHLGCSESSGRSVGRWRDIRRFSWFLW